MKKSDQVKLQKQEQAFRLWLDGGTMRDVAKQLKISPGTVSAWKDKLNWMERRGRIQSMARSRSDALTAHRQTNMQSVFSDLHLGLAFMAKAYIEEHRQVEGDGISYDSPASVNEFRTMVSAVADIQDMSGHGTKKSEDDDDLLGQMKILEHQGPISIEELTIKVREIHLGKVEETVKDLEKKSDIDVIDITPQGD